ncbi:MAG: hypothetical protein U0930_17500 [Pirellulales bacterium]
MNRCLALLALLLLVGCGETITRTADPIQVTFKATSGGKPLNDVTLTLQPMAAGGQQSDIKIVKGEGSGPVIPGTYTYYVEKGKDMAVVEKLPDAFRRGSMDRKLEINQVSTIEVKLD